MVHERRRAAPKALAPEPAGRKVSNEPRLTQSLRALLQSQRVAALGTVNADGTPLVSMVPFAMDPVQPCVVIHVSGLAAHTGNLQRSADVSLMVMQAEAPGEPVHALRVTGARQVAGFGAARSVSAEDLALVLSA